MPKEKLSTSMTLKQFNHGYWYTAELKQFARRIGIPSANKLRKDELETAVKLFLQKGRAELPTQRNLVNSGTKDSERRLTLKLPVVNYTNNKETKDFILAEAKKIDSKFKIKSGTRYLLNRWREEQLTRGVVITYGDIVNQIMKLGEDHKGPLRMEHGRYINFISDFMADKAGSKAQAIEAWSQIKQMDSAKTYASWKKLIQKS